MGSSTCKDQIVCRTSPAPEQPDEGAERHRGDPTSLAAGSQHQAEARRS